MTARQCIQGRKGHPLEEAHLEFEEFLVAVSTKPEFVKSIEQDIVRIARERTSATEERRERSQEERRQIDRQMRTLIGMRAAELISDDEFRHERATLSERSSTLDQRLTYEVCAPEQVQAAMAEIVQPLQDVLGTWRAMPVELRRRFVQFILPLGFVREEVRTAELGLLFRVFGLPDNGNSSGGTLSCLLAGALGLAARRSTYYFG